MKVLQLASAAGLYLLSITINAQNNPNIILDSLASRLLRSNSTSPSLYVHVDKQVQVAGSFLWFKIYLFHHSTHLPYAGGTNVYTDLVNAADSTIEHAILESADINLDGGFKLSRDLEPGYYFLRTYTSEMLSSSPERICTIPIYISNPLRPSPNPPASICFPEGTKAIPRKGIQFYPEGNALINGVDNKVAITTFDDKGNPFAARGIIKDSRDSVVSTFITNKDGIGSFSIFPYKARKYKAIVETGVQKGQEAALPDVPLLAYQLGLVKEDSSNLYFRVALSDQLYSNAPASYLIGMGNGKVCFAAAGMGMYNVTVPKTSLPQGVASFFLFDDKQQLASRRIVYNARKNLQVQVVPDKDNYFARATVRVNVTVKDENSKPQSALLSVAVTDNRALPYGAPGTFADFSYQQFMGNGSLLKSNSTFAAKDLELIALSSQLPLQIEHGNTDKQEAGGIDIAGYLYNKDKAPIANQPITLLSADQPSIFFMDTTDARGYFSFPGMRYFDSTRMMIYAVAKGQKPNEWLLKLNKDTLNTSVAEIVPTCFGDSLLRPTIAAFEASKADTFLTGNTKVWLQEVIVQGKKGRRTSNTVQIKHGGRIITKEQLSKQALGTTANAVKMVPGVMVMNGKITIRGGTPNLSGSSSMDANIEPMVIVDGVQSTLNNGGVESYLNSIPPDNIDYIEVLTGPEASMYGTRAANGVIIVKTGLPSTYLRDMNNLLAFYPKGYHLAPPFYQPDYSNDAVKEADFRDNRSTIFWSGNLMTDAEGKLQIQFYSADPTTSYTVTIRGLTSKGIIIDEQVILKRQ